MKILLFLIILYLDAILGNDTSHEQCPFLQNQKQILEENPDMHEGHLEEHCRSETAKKSTDGDDVVVPDSDTTTVRGCECESACGATIDFGRSKCDWCYTKDKCGHFSYTRRKYYDYCLYPERRDYEADDWKIKEANLYEQIIADNTPGVEQNTIGLLAESVITSLEANWDVMPAGRKKFIHSIAGICKIDLTITDTKYSGVFEQGVTSGFMRMGPAMSVNKDARVNKGIAPGIGWKFMRTGVQSANWVTLHSQDNIGNYNYFSVSQSNHVPPATGLAAKILSKFYQASNCPTKVGLSYAAQFNQNGEEAKDLKFPYKLVFQPTVEAQNIMTEDPKTMDEILEAMRTIPIGTTVWNVYAQEDPSNNQLDVLGHVKTTSPVDSSAFGDNSFFIRHQRWEEDMQLRPEWIPHTDPEECGVGLESVDIIPPADCTHEEAADPEPFHRIKDVVRGIKSIPKKIAKKIIGAFAKGIVAGVEYVHELEVTWDRGVHTETVIPGVYTYNGLHDVVEEVLQSHLAQEVDILKGGVFLLTEVLEKLKGQKRTPELWAEIQQGVRDTIGNQDVHFPETLDTMQLITLMKYNPFFTMGMHFDETTDQYCFDATKNSPNRLVSLVFSAFDDDYANSKLFFSKDLTEVTLEVAGQTYTESMGVVFHKKLRVFVTAALYWFQSCHATLHVYIYVMLGSANKATYKTNLSDFVDQYEPNILLKYLEVKATLYGGINILLGGKNTWKVTDSHAAQVAALEIFKTYAGARNSRDWLRQVFLANCPEMIYEPEIQKEAKKYSKMLPHLSDATMNTLRKHWNETSEEFVEEVAAVSDKLVDYLRRTDGGVNAMENYFGINTFQDWIECQGMAGILHGNTLSFTRLQFTDYCVYSGEWDTDILEDQSSTAVSMGTLLGLEDFRAVNEVQEVENTVFENMMGLFNDWTKGEQQKFWDSLSTEDKESHTWCKSVWGPNMLDNTQLTVTSYI